MNVKVIGYYIKTRMKHGVGRMMAIVILLAAILWFSMFYENYIIIKEHEIDYTYETIPVQIVVTNIAGDSTEGLSLTDKEINMFISDRYYYEGVKQPVPLSAYVKNVAYKIKMLYKFQSEFGYNEEQNIYGISEAQIEYDFPKIMHDEINYYEGWTSEVFSKEEFVCVVSKEVLQKLKEIRELEKQSQSENAEDGDENTENSDDMLTINVSKTLYNKNQQEKNFSLKIIGEHTLPGKTIYVPWRVARMLCEGIGDYIEYDNLRMEVADNKKLDELRTLLKRHFVNINQIGIIEKIDNVSSYSQPTDAMIIHDDMLRKTLNSLNQNLQTLYRLKPIFVFIEIALCFVVAFFYFHIRRKEFAIGRSLGNSKGEIIGIILYEIFLVLIVSNLIGISIFLLTNKGEIKFIYLALLSVSSILGAIISGYASMGRKALRSLKEDE